MDQMFGTLTLRLLTKMVIFNFFKFTNNSKAIKKQFPDSNILHRWFHLLKVVKKKAIGILKIK